MIDYGVVFSQLTQGELFLVILLIVWTAVWKLLALWKAAKNGHVGWFILIGILNTVGILPILYIYVFSKKKIKARKK